MNSGDADNTRLEHAWKYFELHSGQRMTLFNYFLVLASIALAALASCLQGARYLWPVGIALGGMLAIVSWVFWKLDQRTSFLIKHAEKAIGTFEAVPGGDGAGLITSERRALESANAARNAWSAVWTYGRSFRFVFLAMALVGIAGAGMCGGRMAGWWSESEPTQQPIKVECIAR